MSAYLKVKWRNTDIPIHKGQRLVCLRTHTDGNTLYLFDYDGECPGWVPHKAVDAVSVVNHEDTYIAIVTNEPDLQAADASFEVFLAKFDRPGMADRLRDLDGWPNALGDDPGVIEHHFPELYKLLTTPQKGSPAFPVSETVSKGTSMTSATKTTDILPRLSRTVAENGDAMKNAGFLEAGVIVNRQLVKLAASKAPLMVRGYVDTPIGKLAVANLFSVIVHELRPNDPNLRRLADASLEAAHLDMIRTLDIDGLIDELLSSDSIKRALGSLKDGE